jgi:hypothetical protein
MYLDESTQKKLRQIGKIGNDEVLLKEGDLFIALNVVTQQRRIIPGDADLLEALSQTNQSEGRKILKG